MDHIGFKKEIKPTSLMKIVNDNKLVELSREADSRLAAALEKM